MAAPDPLALFRLKQIRVARVSEISEATAAAPVPDEERVNFHIGNPFLRAKWAPRSQAGFDRVGQSLAIVVEFGGVPAALQHRTPVAHGPG